MSIRVHVDAELACTAMQHLVGGVDRLGFFLADVAGTVITLEEWHPVPESDLEPIPDGHAVLNDAAALRVLRWARKREKSLVEVHSHGQYIPAAFSSIDLDGLTEWVPGVRWRLGGAPYVALVTAGDTVDAWAWMGTAHTPLQVEALVIGGSKLIRTTGATLERIHAAQRD